MNEQMKRNSFQQDMYGKKMRLKDWSTPDLNSQSFTNNSEVVYPKRKLNKLFVGNSSGIDPGASKYFKANKDLYDIIQQQSEQINYLMLQYKKLENKLKDTKLTLENKINAVLSTTTNPNFAVFTLR